METVDHPPSQPETEELRLLLEWQTDPVRTREAGVASTVIHIAAIAVLMLLPKDALLPTPRHEASHITPLIAPPQEIAQNVPNRGKLSKEINASSVLPRERIQVPPSPPSTTRPAAPRSSPTPLNPPAPRVEPAAPVLEPPKIEVAENRPAQVPLPQLPPAAPPPEKPKLALENPQAPPATPGGRVAVPSGSVSEAVRSVARGSSGGIMVGDTGIGMGGIGEMMNQPPSPGRQGSALELLSDPMGVDFRPYLLKILVSVRRNWWAVMPESAKLGRRGRVAIQFSINRVGQVPKLVIVSPSGTDALDRAAVAGISASNPFPPLPTDFRGDQIRLQFTFAYNMPSN